MAPKPGSYITAHLDGWRVRPPLARVDSSHQRRRSHSEENPDRGMSLRIGVSAGEPVRNDNQLWGAAVNLAAKLCTHASPGSILITQVVHHVLVAKRIPFIGFGEVEAKGFERPIPLINVAWRDT